MGNSCIFHPDIITGIRHELNKIIITTIEQEVTWMHGGSNQVHLKEPRQLEVPIESQ
jgi:hypothetical protein